MPLFTAREARSILPWVLLLASPLLAGLALALLSLTIDDPATASTVSIWAAAVMFGPYLIGAVLGAYVAGFMGYIPAETRRRTRSYGSGRWSHFVGWSLLRIFF